MKLKQRNISDVPNFWYSDIKTWDPTKQALVYIDTTISKVVGSSGGQTNAENMTPYECIVATHEQYSNRGDNRVHNIVWGVIDINRIKNSHELDATNKDQRQFDRLIRKELIDKDTSLRVSKLNKEVLLKNNKQLSEEESLQLLEDAYGDSRTLPQQLPLDSNQLAICQARQYNRVKHKDKDLLVNAESGHTRLGKDKANKNGVDEGCEIFLYPSGFFATFQIEDEMTENDRWVKWMGRTPKQIMEDIYKGLASGKKVHIPVSGFEKGDSERLKVLKIFKGKPITITADEVDYQQWKQVDFYKKLLKYVA